MTQDAYGATSASILEDVDDLIDASLRLRRAGSAPRYGTKAGSVEVMPLTDESAWTLIKNIRREIQRNWDYAEHHSESQQNWRFTKNKGIDPGNQSKEVQYERALVNIPEDVWPDSKNWANQVPVASGLTGSNSDRRRCIDLVHKGADREYDFIELKIKSNTPLFAAMEILTYGILYVFYREADCISKYRHIHENENMLIADAIHLMVAAPSAYYRDADRDVRGSRVDRSWLEPSLNAGLSRFLIESGFTFKMDFAFRICGYPPFPPSALLGRAQ